MQGSVMAIQVPPKVWRPKQQNRFTPPEYANDIDEGVFEFKEFGNAVYRPKEPWPEGAERDDIIHFDAEQHTEELEKNIRINDKIPGELRQEIITLVMKYWDCFCQVGARRTILGYEFAIDTGTAKPVCCRKAQYGPYESEIIMDQIRALLGNDWIEKCKGPWGSTIVLAPKPHQEHISNIDDFVWRMCVSYRKLNSVTKPFEYPIPRCDDAIESVGSGSDRVWIISLDARQGYHQISVRLVDREKLAFFSPDNEKYCFKVMPFGPTNAPGFYSAMMKNLKDEWDFLFIQIVRTIKFLSEEPVTVTAADEIFIGGKKVVAGTKTIIDDILLWCNNIELIMIYLECICKIFKKYRVSFRLDKCDFLKERVEYVGHDILSHGNCPASSKFNLIQDWKLPTTGPALFSFIGLVNFYHRYAPYFEIKLKPLRKLNKQYYRKGIPIASWTPELISLFEELKVGITSSPVLARFDPNKPTFLKTDWSAEGMGWILMQPADDEESVRATKLLKKTGECLFDLSKNGARLRPIAFGSRSCTDIEKSFHSFVGETASGRWAISQNRKYLWGCHFYWMCDCSAVKEVLEYSGTIHFVMRWSQELLGYQFSVIHRNNRMMIDVDGLTRRFGPLIAQYCMIASILSQRDRAHRPMSYDPELFVSSKTARVCNPELPILPLLTTKFIASQMDNQGAGSPLNIVSAEATKGKLLLTTCPITVVRTPTNLVLQTGGQQGTTMRALEIPNVSIVNWLCIDDITGATNAWVVNQTNASLTWNVSHTFSTRRLSRLFEQIHPDTPFSIKKIPEAGDNAQVPSEIHLLDALFTPGIYGSVIHWIQDLARFLAAITAMSTTFVQASFWIPSTYFPTSIHGHCRLALQRELQEGWDIDIHAFNATEFKECIHAERYIIQVTKNNPDGLANTSAIRAYESDDNSKTDLEQHLTSASTVNLQEFDFLSIPSNALLQETPGNHSQLIPRVVAIIENENPNVQDTMTTSNFILDSGFPAQESCKKEASNTLFGRRFGIAMKSADGTWFARPPSTLELLRMYSVVVHEINTVPPHFDINDIADDLLPFSLPWTFRSEFLNDVSPVSTIMDDFMFSDSTHSNAAQCFFSKASTETFDWEQAYLEDPETVTVMQLLLNCHDKPSFTDEQLQTVSVSYKTALKDNRIQLVNGKLVLYKPFQMNTRCVALVIVPASLRKKVFSHFHAGPSAGHMGEYKTLFRLRLRFFWPGLRGDCKAWIKGCAHCVAFNVWRTRKEEMHFSWPITIPFYIMHLDLWSPGLTVDGNGKAGYLLNSMCDLTQFVVSSVTFDTKATVLAKLFMEDVILSFGMVAVVVVDADSRFRGVFEEVCTILKITMWPLARGNHKGLSVERYHRFLNKTQAIAGQDRGTHEVFQQNAKTSQYAWNSAPIDDTDVMRSVAAIGREFRFPLDIEFLGTPTLNDDSNSGLYNYLRHVSGNSTFAIGVLQTLIEERRTAHRDRWNKSRVPQEFKVGDVVKVHIQVQSKAASGEVKKLSYQARGPFQVIKCLDHNSYEVQRYNEPESATRKYKGTELYLLPPIIYPHEPLDLMDERYLNYAHAPIVSPLMKPLRIELYEDSHLIAGGVTVKDDKVDQPISTLDAAAFEDHVIPIMPSAEELFVESGTLFAPPEIVEHIDTLNVTHDSIQASRDKLFFIRYTPAGTMRPRWFLVQVDIESTVEINPEFLQNGRYFCAFLAKHPNDARKSDEFGRWWPDWYRYKTTKTTNEIVYGDRILFRPSVIPDSTKFIQWATDIQLIGDTHIVLQGPFNFEALSESNRTLQKVQEDKWHHLATTCLDSGIVPPTLGAFSSLKPGTERSQNTRKRKLSYKN
jgi:hypothetical protein